MAVRARRKTDVEGISILVREQIETGLISSERQGDKSYYLGPLFLPSGLTLRPCIPIPHPGPHESKWQKLGRPQETALRIPKWDPILKVCIYWNRGTAPGRQDCEPGNNVLPLARVCCGPEAAPASISVPRSTELKNGS